MQADKIFNTAWQAAILQGTDQLDCGEGVAYSPEVLEYITQSAIEAMHSNKPMDADVRP